MSELKQTGSETQIATSADVSNAVSGVAHLSGNETFTGTKTFNNTIYVGDGSSSNMMLTSGDIRKMTNGTVKTYSFPSTGGTLELQGHTHSSIVSPDSSTGVVAANTGMVTIVGNAGVSGYLEVNSNLGAQGGSEVYISDDSVAVGGGTAQTSYKNGQIVLGGQFQNATLTLPNQTGTLELQGHTHNKITSGSTAVFTSGDGTASISATGYGESYVSAHFNDFDAYYGSNNDYRIYSSGDNIVFHSPYNGDLSFPRTLTFYKTTGWSNIWYPSGWEPTGDPNYDQYPTNLMDVWFYDESYGGLISPDTSIIFSVTGWNSDTPKFQDASGAVGYDYQSGYGSISGGPIRTTISTFKTIATVDQIPPAQVQSDWNQSDSSQKDYIKNKPGIPKIFYGSSTETGATVAKTAYISGFTLTTGVIVYIKFLYANIAANPTLNVNSTGAKSIYRYKTVASFNNTNSNQQTYSWHKDEVVGFLYNGSAWMMLKPADASVDNQGIVRLTSTYAASAADGNHIAPTQWALYNAYNDLNTNKADIDHTHAASAITSGTLALARIPTGTTSSTVALGDHTHVEYVNGRSITYADLVALRTASQLVPGTTYRITDYSTTTSTTNTQSAGNVFDLLVVADDVNKLNENARAIQHSGDTYFANCKLEAWKIKYCLDNNTAKFEWASSSGKGVIYEMEDEWGNKCGYDFKNIQFKRYAITTLTSTLMEGNGLTSLQSSLVYNSSSPYVAMAVDAVVPSIYGCTATIDANTFQWKYTFNNTGAAASDASLDGSARCNDIGARIVSKVFKLNNITLLGACYSNKIGEDCYNISTRSSVSRANFGHSCHDMLLGGFGQGSFGNFCSNIAIGGSALVASRYTHIGDACSDISSGMRVWNCAFGQSCSKITLGTYTHKCTFGAGCSYIHFGSSTGSKSYYQHITIEPGNQYIYLNCTGTTSTSAYYQNVTVGKGVNTTTTWKTITDANTNQNYKTTYQAENSLVIPV